MICILKFKTNENGIDAGLNCFFRIRAVAGEVLAVYFLECRKELLVEWLDAVGLEHEEGTLELDAPPPPPQPELRKALERYLALDDDPDRRLLLAAFAAQDAIDWPDLEALLAADS